MDLSDAESRHERGNAILFTRDSPCLSALRRTLESSDRRTVAIWGLERARRTAEELRRRHPDDPRPILAVEASTRWCRGEINMPEAKRAILDVHAMAREMDSPADSALCHAVGQGCSCVHTPKHALGLPVYELTAAFLEGGTGRVGVVAWKATSYLVDLKRIGEMDKDNLTWAPFLRACGDSSDYSLFVQFLDIFVII